MKTNYEQVREWRREFSDASGDDSLVSMAFRPKAEKRSDFSEGANGEKVSIERKGYGTV